MITISEAYQIVKKNEPAMKGIGCLETDNLFAFTMAPKGLRPGDGFANSSVYVVNKLTKAYACVYFMHDELTKERATSKIQVYHEAAEFI